jgi:hypothetical protein
MVHLVPFYFTTKVVSFVNVKSSGGTVKNDVAPALHLQQHPLSAGMKEAKCRTQHNGRIQNEKKRPPLPWIACSGHCYLKCLRLTRNMNINPQSHSMKKKKDPPHQEKPADLHGRSARYLNSSPLLADCSKQR